MTRLARRLDALWFPEAPAARLAMLRILIGAFSLWLVGTEYPVWVTVGQTNAALFQPVGVVALLSHPLSPALHEALVLATLVASVPFLLGWRYRFTGPLFAALLFWVLSYRQSWSMVYHSENLLVLHVLILALAPAADALSLDARRAAGAGPGRGLPSVWARWRGRLRVARSGSALRGIPLAARHLVLGLMPSAETAAVSASRATGGEQQARRRDPAGAWEYGWPIRLMCVVTALAYFVTGMAKVTGELGWSWVSGEALRSQVAADALRKEVLGDAGSSLFYIVYPQLWLFTCFGVMTLLVELGAPFALLNKRLAHLWAVNAFLMHWGILFIMGIKFRYHLSGVIYAPLFEVEWLAGWAGAWWRRWATAGVVPVHPANLGP